MARNDGKRENQHYVPKVLLRNFSANPDAPRRGQRIWAFDKWKDSAFQPNISGIAAVAGFYDIEHEGKTISVEGKLSELETHVGPVLSRVIADRKLSTLSAGERQWLSIFCAVQFVRVQHVREQHLALNEALADKLRATGADPGNVKGFELMDEAAAKEFSIATMFDAALKFEPYFAQKACFLFEAPTDGTFFIGDNPIALHNDRSFGPYGNLGLSVPGIQISLPISPTFTLAMWDPGLLDEIHETITAYKRDYGNLVIARAINIHARIPEADRTIAQARSAIDRVDALLNAAKTGGVQRLEPEELTFMNSLQVMLASRFVMSCRNDFSLVRRMISDDLCYRKALGFKLD